MRSDIEIYEGVRCRVIQHAIGHRFVIVSHVLLRDTALPEDVCQVIEPVFPGAEIPLDIGGIDK